MKRIYLDNNATTCLEPRLCDLFLASLQKCYGNPSSIHSFGQEAKAELIAARQILAQIFHVQSNEIIFTSSATEAINLLLRGILGETCTGHCITSSVEHAAVYETLLDLEKSGLELSYLPVGSLGAPSVQELELAIRPHTRLIVLMAANNETGVRTDIDAMAEVALRHNIPLVVDAVALFGKEAFTLHPGISACVFSGHKFHAPKGVAFAVVRKGLKLRPYLTGGHQELGRRAGTENLAAIVAMCEAARLTYEELDPTVTRMRFLRDYFESELFKRIPGVKINGLGPRIANTSNLSFPGSDGELLLMHLDLHGVAASLGSACSSGALEPSRVLLNMGLTRDEAMASLRFSLSRFTTKDELDQTIAVLSQFKFY
jgi:cysteine desulfurase